MKVARWQRIDGAMEAGIIHEGHALPLRGGLPVDALLTAGLTMALEAGRELIARNERDTWRPLDRVRLLPPLVPASIRNFSVFQSHEQGLALFNGASGVSPSWYTAPTFHFSNPHTLIGAYDTLTAPADRLLDFGMQVAAVVGAVRESDGRNLPVERAKDQIFGYAVLNSWSVRDAETSEGTAAHSAIEATEVAATMGPWIVTADEFEDRGNDDGLLDIEVEGRVNGDLIGRDRLTNMEWSFSEMIALGSRDSRVAPGDVIASGTVGSGCLAEAWGRSGALDPPPLAEGDTVTISVEGIGVIRNTIGVARHEVRGFPVARSRRSPAQLV